VGRVRDHNEDSVLARSLVFAVADGLGGHAAGEVASRLAVETIVPFLRAVCLGGAGEGQVARGLVASIEAAADRIKQEARRAPHLARMGTTATLAALVDRSLVCAQVGDSRAYLLHGNVLTQLTHDQTMAELLRASGNVPIEQIHEIVGAHVILQAVGSSVRLDVAITHTAVETGDTVLLCSDGLSGVVPDRLITETLLANEDPDRACDALVARALEAGAPDNVTCVVFRVG
jgi:protein phosphatase